MEIILLSDVEGLGARGDIVNVARGYFRNYLGPKGLAVLAGAGEKRRFAEEERVRQLRDGKNIAAAEALAGRLTGLGLQIGMQADEDGKLFGSVTTLKIAEALDEKGFAVDRHGILLDEPIKELGDYDIEIKLHAEVKAAIRITVSAL